LLVPIIIESVFKLFIRLLILLISEFKLFDWFEKTLEVTKILLTFTPPFKNSRPVILQKVTLLK